MVTKVINIQVKDGDVKELEKDLKKIETQSKSLESQSKKTSKTLQDGIEGAESAAGNLRGGLGGIVTQYKTITKAAKISGKAMKSALISTGVGALIVALGVIVDNWEEILEFVGFTNKEIERQNELLSIQAGVADAELSYLKTKLDLYKSQGRSVEEIEEIESKLSQRRFQRQEELTKQIKNQKALYDKLKEGNPNDPEDVKAAADAYKSLLNLLKERIRIQKEIDKASTVTLTGPSGKKEKEEKPQKEKERQEAQDRALRKKMMDIRKAEIKQQTVDLLKITREQEEVLIGREKRALDFTLKMNEKKAKSAQALEDFKVQVASNGLNALASLAKEGSAFAKGVAVAQAIMTTYQGINKALAETTDFTPTQTLRFANAAAVGIAGFANVAKILSTNEVGMKSSPKAGGASGGGGVSAPSFNIVGTSGTNQLAESLQQDQNPIQAYVVGSNVTTQQELDRNIVDTATIG